MAIDRGSKFIALLCYAALVVACRQDKPEPPVSTTIDTGAAGGVYITNEGNFQWGNASVSYYDPNTNTVAEDLYAPANGTPMGDVCQSMRLHNGKAYVVLNNSNRILVVDPGTFVLQATIPGLSSPRYFLPVSLAKAYVTDLYANTIQVVDLGSNTVVGNIPCPGWTEELVLAFGRAFVTNRSRPYLYVVDTAMDQVVDSIAIGHSANSIVEDAQGKLWVACSGNSGQSAPPTLHRIDPATRTVEATFTFPSGDGPWRLRTNGAHDVLYFLNRDLYRMAIHANELPTAPIVSAGDRNFYGLGIDPTSGTVYVCDAIDYVQQGAVYRYTPTGEPLGSFMAGTIPGDLVFR